MIEQQEFHWSHVDASRELLWQVIGVVVSKQTMKLTRIHISWFLDDKQVNMANNDMCMIQHVVLLDLTWFDNFWSSFARKSSSTFVELADSPAFALSGIFIITWCDANQNMLENNTTLVKAGGAQAIQNKRHKRTPARQVNTKLGNILKNKTQQILSLDTNDGKQNKPSSYIVILSPEWWL